MPYTHRHSISIDITYYQYASFERFMKAHVGQYVEPLSHAAFSMTKTGKRFHHILELSFLTMYVLPLRQSTSKRISCFHYSLSMAKRMKASFKHALVTALVRRFLIVSIRHFGLRALSCVVWKRTVCVLCL